MLINPFAAPLGYSDLLNKLGWFSFFVNMILSFIFSNFIFNIYDNYSLNFLGSKLPLFHFNIYLGDLVYSGLVALISRIIRFHNIISTILNIRKNYEINHIVLPIASRSNVGLDIEKIREKRSKIMAVSFYAYLNDIDQHPVKMFWDQIFWYWMTIESIAYILFFAVYCFILSDFYNAYIYISISLILIIFSRLLLWQASHATEREVSEILNDSVRFQQINKDLSKI